MILKINWMLRLLLFVLFFSFLFCEKSYSQQDSISDKSLDSLLQLVNDDASQDTITFQRLIKIGEIYWKKLNLEKARYYYLESEKLATQLDNPNLLIRSYYHLILADVDSVKFEQILFFVKNYMSNLSVFSEKELPVFVTIARFLNLRKRYSEALELLYYVEKEYEDRPNSQLSLFSVSVIKGEIFSALKDYKGAEENAIKSQEYAKLLGIPDYTVMGAMTICWLERERKNYSKAIDCYHEILKDTASLSTIAKSQVLTELTIDYNENGQYESAINFGNKAMNIGDDLSLKITTGLTLIKAKKKLGDLDGVVIQMDKVEKLIMQGDIYSAIHLHEFLYERGRYFQDIRQYEYAKTDFTNALEHIDSSTQSIYNSEERIKILEALTSVYSKTNDFEKAFFFQEKIRREQDKQIQEEAVLKGQKFAYQKVLEQNQNEQTLLQQKNHQQRNLLVLASLLAFSFLIFGGIIWRQSIKISKEKKKSEDLLFNILPSSIAHRMVAGETTVADKFDAATVVFIDIVGFTKLSSTIPPEEVIQLLNIVFSKIDSITEQFHLEKIKTIGDCYMAVSGIPTSSDNHVQNALDFCLKVLNEIDGKENNGKTIHLKIGVESGPVMAGVIGKKRFFFDLWGDTVNTASRMETNGITGTIQTTRNVYDKIKDKQKYPFLSQGKIQIKGKGELEVFVLEKYV